MADTVTGKGVVVAVEYCSGWGYGARYEKLEKEILAALPNAEVTGTKGRTTSFEVSINGKPVYSKLKAGKFPDFASVVKAVDRAARGLEPVNLSTAPTYRPSANNCPPTVCGIRMT